MAKDPRNDDERVAPTLNQADARHAAVRWLAAREHSQQELSRKLQRKGWTSDQADAVLEQLSEAGLQSDERFAESFIRSRSGKNYGPVRIRAELQQRGVSRGLIESALQEAQMDWFSIAANWYERRYGTEAVADAKERSKRQQALARRGFTTDVIRELVN